MEERDRKTIEADEVAFFAKFYGTEWYNPVGWRLRLKRELNSLRRARGGKSLGRVLSVACGDAQFEILLSPYAESITAVDISPDAIKVAQRNADKAGVKNIRFECTSVFDLDLADQFDTIVCICFLHHVPEPALPGFLERMHRHLKPGGLFYAQDPNSRGILRTIGRVIMGKNYDKYHSPDERELDPKDTENLLQSTGFSGVRVRQIDVTLFPALYILAGKPGWPLYACAAIDWVWCRSPLAPWASGFAIFGSKSA